MEALVTGGTIFFLNKGFYSLK